MGLDTPIKLRPRSERISLKTIDEIKLSCELLKKTHRSEFKIQNTGHLIWITMGSKKLEYWSPTLSIELEKQQDNTTLVKIIHGPDPILWTMFMALHYITAIVFIVFGIIAYSKWSLNQSFIFDIFIMIIMIDVWLLLYFVALLNRKKGIYQTQELVQMMEKMIH